MLLVVRLELSENRRASLCFPPTSANTVPVCFPHLSPAKAPLIYLLLSLSATFPPSATLRSIHPSIHPFILRLIPSQLSNLIPHLWTAWDISPEMRSVTLNTGVEDSARGGGGAGSPSRAEVTSLGLAKTLLPLYLPGSPPEVAGLNICPLPHRRLEMSSLAKWPSSSPSSSRANTISTPSLHQPRELAQRQPARTEARKSLSAQLKRGQN